MANNDKAELGSGRLDTLPCEDDSRPPKQNYHYLSVPAVQIQRTAVNTRWAEAIEGGVFDDDDAQQVKGIDCMDNGNTARWNRHKNAMATNELAEHGYSEKGLPRDQHGQVPPRAQFLGQRRNRNLRKNQILHRGDDPIDIDATLANTVHGSAVKATRARGNGRHDGGRSTRGSGSHDRNPLSHSIMTQSAATPQLVTVEMTPAQQQGGQQKSQDQVGMGLPDKSSVLVQLSVTMQSSVFPERNRVYQGDVFLVSSHDISSDMVILAINNQEIDIRHPISEFSNVVTGNSTSAMLVFTVSDNMKFYSIDFDQAENMTSFVKSIRELAGRSRQKSTMVTSNSTNAAALASAHCQQSPVPGILPQATATPKSTSAHKAVPTEAMAYSLIDVASESITNPNSTNSQVGGVQANLVQNFAPMQPHTVATPTTAGQDVDAAEYVPDMIIDEIVDLVTNTAKYMRDCSPVGNGITTMHAIIQGTTAATLRKQCPKFNKLSKEKQATFMEMYYVPAVTSKFLKWLQSDQKSSTCIQADGENKPTLLQLPSPKKTIQLTQPKTAPKTSSIVYNMKQLMALRSAAAKGPCWLRDLDFLQQARYAKQTHKQTSQHKGPDIPTIKEQINRAAPVASWVNSTPSDGMNAGSQIKNLGPASVPNDQGEQSYGNIPYITVTAASDQAGSADRDDPQQFAEWMFGPKSVTPSTKAVGLNSSIHNREGINILGPVSGQFTGAFTKTPEFQDLIGIFENAKKDENEVCPLANDFRRLSLE